MIDTTPSTLATSRERFGWVLIPLALIAYGCAFFFALGAIVGGSLAVTSIGSTDPVTVSLHGQTELHQGPGTHAYSGGPYIADDTVVTATSATTEVSGVDAASRLALRLGPALWEATVAVVATALGVAISRIGGREPRPAARPVTVAAAALAVGSTVAQAVTAYGTTRLGHVAWIGLDGIDGFTAIPNTVFDLTPLAVAGALLAVVVVLRRNERLTEALAASAG